jgi:hypothetical protein
MSYSPLFQTLHDERDPVDDLGRGTHYRFVTRAGPQPTSSTDCVGPRELSRRSRRPPRGNLRACPPGGLSVVAAARFLWSTPSSARLLAGHVLGPEAFCRYS